MTTFPDEIRNIMKENSSQFTSTMDDSVIKDSFIEFMKKSSKLITKENPKEVLAAVARQLEMLKQRRLEAKIDKPEQYKYGDLKEKDFPPEIIDIFN
jgi:glutamate synthase domain-containing protein 1